MGQKPRKRGRSLPGRGFLLSEQGAPKWKGDTAKFARLTKLRIIKVGSPEYNALPPWRPDPNKNDLPVRLW